MIKAQQKHNTKVTKKLNKPIHASIRYIQSTRTSTIGEARCTFFFRLNFLSFVYNLYDTQYSSTNKNHSARALV